MRKRLSLKAKHSATGAVYADKCVFHGMILGTDGANDPVVTLYDNASAASGTEVVPTCTYDASMLGLNGVTGLEPGILCSNGLYIEITCAGAVEVTVYYTPYYAGGEHLWSS